jgi:hypothetical protein
VLTPSVSQALDTSAYSGSQTSGLQGLFPMIHVEELRCGDRIMETKMASMGYDFGGVRWHYWSYSG